LRAARRFVAKRFAAASFVNDRFSDWPQRRMSVLDPLRRNHQMIVGRGNN
jgi:hypothetical protein